jgi:hypothetical protein
MKPISVDPFMTSDFLGNPVTGADATALTAIDAFIGGLISYETRILGILDVTAAPMPALVATFAGILHLLAETSGAETHAEPFLAAAREAAGRDALTSREVLWIEVLRQWIAGDINGTITTLDTIVAQSPRDRAALKLLQYHHFNRGEFAGMLRPALAVHHSEGDLPYLGGMLAFAYEQLHLLDEAEKAAWAGLGVVPTDPWAQHALAHVWLTRGQIDEGLAALTQWSSGWQDLNSFMVTHCGGTLLSFISAREIRHGPRALRHADLGLRQELFAGSGQGRLDAGPARGVGGRCRHAGPIWANGWRPARPISCCRSFRYNMPMASPALDAQRPIPCSPRWSRPPTGRKAIPIWRDAALPLARGLVAHARGDHVRAVALLGDAVPRLSHLGGSHAQRDLFALVLLDAQVKAGAWADAQQALELRRVHDPRSVPLNTTLARVYDALGLPEQAAAGRASRHETHSRCPSRADRDPDRASGMGVRHLACRHSARTPASRPDARGCGRHSQSSSTRSTKGCCGSGRTARSTPCSQPDGPCLRGQAL